jgi:hypothetical protein
MARSAGRRRGLRGQAAPGTCGARHVRTRHQRARAGQAAIGQFPEASTRGRARSARLLPISWRMRRRRPSHVEASVEVEGRPSVAHPGAGWRSSAARAASRSGPLIEYLPHPSESSAGSWAADCRAEDDHLETRRRQIWIDDPRITGWFLADVGAGAQKGAPAPDHLRGPMSRPGG